MKKFIAIVCVSLWSFGADAVLTSYCPEILQMELSNYQSSSGDSTSEIVLEGTLELYSAAKGICSYRNMAQEGDIVEARLQGSVKAGAKDPAYLVAYYNLDSNPYAAYIDVTAMDWVSIDFSNHARIYSVSEICHYGCAPSHKRIGSAEFVFVAE